MRAAKDYLTYAGGAPYQPAMAHALRDQDRWVEQLRDSFQRRRDRLASALHDISFEQRRDTVVFA